MHVHITVAVAAVASCVLLMFAGNALRNDPDDRLAYESRGIDPTRADADELVASVTSHARAWKFDAAFWSIELNGVDRRGTVDLTGRGRASVVFVSPSRVASVDKQRRRDALRRYTFGRRRIQVSGTIGVQRRWRNLYLPPRPGCTIAKLAGALRVRGLTGQRTIRVSFDPNVAYGPDGPSELSWLVTGDTDPLKGWFSMQTCRQTKAIPARGS